MIFLPRSTYVGEFCLGPVLIKDIFSGLASVEDINAPTEVPGGQ